MDTILIVDDDKMIRHMLRKTLEQNDYLILEAANTQRLMDIINAHNVDLILLDIQLKDGNGINFLPTIRMRTHAPIIILSGNDSRENKLEGLNAGADDYIEKPFETDNLIARINANIRRYKGINANENNISATLKKGEDITFGQWILTPYQFQIFDQNGKSGDLTIREFNLLNVLIDNAGRPVKRDELCNAIREDTYVPTPRAIDVKITRIRKKIGDNATKPNIIKTVRGVGYMIDHHTITRSQ